MRKFLILGCFALLLGASCEDWRPDQRDDNLFDPANAFIRFDFGNTVNGVAKDSVLLKRSGLDSILIPVALSAPVQRQEVSVRLEVKALTGAMSEGVHFELRLGSAPLPVDKIVRLAPGQFVQMLTFKELRLPDAGPQRLRLELTEVSPASIYLGFPGSGRGRFFDLVYTN